MSNTFTLRAAKAPVQVQFEIKILETGGRFGVFKKTVEAASVQQAWSQVVKDLNRMGLSVSSITRVFTGA